MKIKIVSAVVIGGKIQKAGSVVDVPRPLALELVSRNRAENIAAAKAPTQPAPNAGDGDGDKGTDDGKGTNGDKK